MNKQTESRCSTAKRKVKALFGNWIVCMAICGGSQAEEVVTIVSSDNEIKSLTTNQVKNIFLGKTRYFPDGQEAEPIDQTNGSSVQQAFYKNIIRMTPAQLKAHWAKMVFTGRGYPPRTVTGDDATKQLVTENPKAIGYIDKKSLDGKVEVVLSEDAEH